MSGYRCVNFNDLCRLCSNPSTNSTSIYGDEALQRKITECLPIILDDKDKLPKCICSQCVEYVNVFSEFRSACTKAQKMLEGCLNSSKLRNGGQVYIKDELPVKKVLKPIQNPSPTKLIPNLCNIVASNPAKQTQQQQQVAKKNVIAANQQDFLSSIIQAVGIQTTDDAADSHNISFQAPTIQPQPATNANTPQYTLTLDGNSLKSGQIQYKIENTAMQSPQLIVKNSNDSQVAQTLSALSNKKNVVIKKVEDKDKKPKFNLILQASPPKPKITPITISPTKKPQIQIQNIEKIMPGGATPGKQLVVPFMVRNDGQIVQQQLPTSPEKTPMKNSNQIAYVQMKIASGADGQLTLTPAQPQQQMQQLQLSLSPQQFQQLNFQSQSTPASNLQQQYTVTHVQNQLQEQSEAQTQTNKLETQEEEDADCDYVDDFEAGDYYMDEEELEEVEEKVEKKSKSGKSKKVKIEMCSDGEDKEIDQEQMEAAKQQLQQLVNLHTKKSDEGSDKSMDLNLTVCDVCKKIFKKKEFLMQHLKSHIGLRPFKCDEPTCNKTFSRKEHLLRHIVSHTGKKMFTCDVCKKLFSRKDNLNKHRRIHPESGQQSLRHSCPQCSKQFAHKAQLAKHLQNCDGKFDVTVKIKDNKKSTLVENAKKKIKVEKRAEQIVKKVSMTSPISTTSATSQALIQQPQQQQQQQTQILTFVQAPQQMKVKNEPQQQQQIILSMSQAQAMLTQQQQKAVYTFPTNLILSDGTTFMTTTNTNEVVGNFKYDNQ